MMSPRVSRFTDLLSLDDQALDARIERRAEPVRLGGGLPRGDAELFEHAASKVFLSDPQVRLILRTLIDAARAHAQSHFPTDAKYRAGLVPRPNWNPWGDSLGSAICFTGLAGVGKSQLLRALELLLESDAVCNVSGYSNLPLVALWLITLRDGAGPSTILQPLVDPPTDEAADLDALGSNPPAKTPQARRKARATPRLLQLCRARSWRDAVCLLAADEFQNVSKGPAFAKATAMLLMLRGIGPKLIFCLNYSLVHKLKRGDQPDHHRLLCNPIVMLPLRQGSAPWLAYLEELKKIAPDVFGFDVAVVERDVHGYTFGIKRNVVLLLKWAYVAARRAGKRCVVDANELRSAYLSIDYSMNRAEVELLWRQSVTGKPEREDLWCPFEGEQAQLWAGDSTESSSEANQHSKVSDAVRAVQEFEARLGDAMINAAMTPEQLEARRMVDPTPIQAHGPAKVIRLPRRKTTRKDLEEGADAIDRLT